MNVGGAIFLGLIVLFIASVIAKRRRHRKAREWATARTALSDKQIASATSAVAPPPLIELKPAPFDVLLSYIDGQHHASERRVTVQRLAIKETTLGVPILEKLGGYCHQQRGPRTFRFDRVQSIADPETGEVIINPVPYLLARAGHRRAAPSSPQQPGVPVG